MSEELEKRFIEVFPDQAETVVPAVRVEPVEEPKAALARFVDAARLAKEVIVKAGFEIEVAGRRYITAQGWAVLGSLFGLSVRITSIKHEEDKDGKPRVIAYCDVLRNGRVIGGAVGVADYSEATYRKDPGWENRPYSHLVSLAQTRAARKALQLLLSHIVALAGYEPEEAPETEEREEKEKTRKYVDPETLAKAIQKALTEL